MFNEKQFNNLKTQLYYEDPKYYFDFASTTPIYKEVIDTITDTMKNNFGNPSSLTETGIKAKNQIKEATATIKDILKASKYNLYYTSGATESNNWVSNILNSNDYVITTGIEHPSVNKSLEATGAKIIYFNPELTGAFDLVKFKNMVEKYNPKLVSIMGVNNETGLILPIYEISKICKDKVLVHCDITQVIPHCLINCNSYNCDFYTFSGHKFGAPKGIGALLIKQSVERDFIPLIYGGHQQDSMRAGTENVPYIIGMALALTKTADLIKEYNAVIVAYQKYFTEKLIKELTKTQTRCIIVNDKGNDNVLFIPNIINICFKNINGYTLMKMLDLKGITVSTGSSCSADYNYISPALETLGIPEEYIHGSIRVSFGFGTTKNSIDYLVDEIIKAISQLEKMR